MEERTNRRGFTEHFVRNNHLKLDDLRQAARDFGLRNNYLYKTNIPESPHPEFHVSHLKHETDGDGLRGIKNDGGFRNPSEDSVDPFKDFVVWWSLALGPEEIQSAEKRFLEETFPDRMEEQAAGQQPFLSKFTTSPAFENTSRLGAYRFTLPLKQVLDAYSTQCCGGKEPIMRIYETVMYKQEVMHVVLVHSPDNQGFSEYPLLTDDPNAICVYRDGRFIWRPEAMSETHRFELIYRRDNNQVEVQQAFDYEFFVWDHVTIALHLGKGQVLEFDAAELRNNIKYCAKATVTFGKTPHDSFEAAEELVKDLWPDVDLPLTKL